jgi:membrane associated rhomboid family serine protease
MDSNRNWYNYKTMSSNNKNGGNGHGQDNDGDNVVQFRPPPPSGAREPLVNLPPAIKFLALAFLGIHGALQISLSEMQRYDFMFRFGFVPGAWTGHVPFSLASAVSPLTYMFLHGSWAHVLINTTMIMAFGTAVERWIGGRKMILLFILCGLASALVHFLYAFSDTNPIVGASGGISGLFAASLILIQQSGGGIAQGPRGMWPMILLWIGISALFGMTGGPGGENIAWVAHIGGFLAGFILIRPVMRLRL